MPSMIVCRCACGSAKRGDDRLQRLRHRMLRRAVVRGARPRAATTRAWRARRRRSVDLVDDVVDLAAERVQRGDRAPPLRRQEQEAVVEARAALRGLLLAVVVGRHAGDAAPADGARGGDACRRRQPVGRVSAGRRRKTSPPTASIRSRMRWPPASTPPISRPRAPRQRREQRPPGFEQRARARRSRRPSARAKRASAARARDRGLGDAEAREVLLRQVDPALAPSRRRRPARN